MCHWLELHLMLESNQCTGQGTRTLYSPECHTPVPTCSLLNICTWMSSSVQSLSCVRFFSTPWITARQASLSITNSQSSFRLTSIELVMSSRYPQIQHISTQVLDLFPLRSAHPLVFFISVKNGTLIYSVVQAPVAQWQRICLQCRRYKRHEFNLWAEQIPWRMAWQPILVFSPREFHGQRSLVGSSPWGRKELDRTEWLSAHSRPQTFILRSKFIRKFFCLYL